MQSSKARLTTTILATVATPVLALFLSSYGPAFAFTPVTGLLAETESKISEEIDSAFAFAREVDEVVTTIISFNDSIQGLSNFQMNDGVPPTNGNSSVQVSAMNDLSILTVGLNSDQSFPVVKTLFSNEYDRLRMADLIETLPLTAPVEGTVTSGFGMRNHPILRGRRMHAGMDIAAPKGTSIYAPGGGTVTFSGRKNGYGNTLIIDHGNGYTTLYGHCSSLLVQEGAKISRGDLVALVGSTGRSTGPHLHYEVRLNNEVLNPEAFIVYDREKTEALTSLIQYYRTF